MAGSKVAEGLLKTWNETLKRFTKVPLKRPVFGEVWKLREAVFGYLGELVFTSSIVINNLLVVEKC